MLFGGSAALLQNRAGRRRAEFVAPFDILGFRPVRSKDTIESVEEFTGVVDKFDVELVFPLFNYSAAIDGKVHGVVLGDSTVFMVNVSGE